jgi:VanZ family protein
VRYDRSPVRVLRPVAWGCVILLAVLSLLPAEEMVRTSLGGHIEHAIAYAGTALMIGLGYPTWGWKRMAIALVIYAGVLELLQNFSPGRHPAVLDWLSSSTGVLIGIAFTRVGDEIWLRWRRKGYQSD